MSVGIVVANKHGIAIATDSATTLGNRGLVYHSYQKLIHLAPNLPVAVAVYGNIDFMNVPIDILLAHYQQTLANTHRRQSELLAYPDDFIQHLETHKNELHLESNERFNIEQSIIDFLESMANVVYPIDETNLVDLVKFSEWVELVSKHILMLPLLELEPMQDYVFSNYRSLISKKIKEFFPQLTIPETIETSLIRSLSKIFDTTYFYTKTGLVFAGFGENNLYPSFRGIYLFGMINGKIRWTETKRFLVNEDYSRGFYAFAQSHAIDTFIDGIDPSVQEDLYNSIQKSWTRKIEEMDTSILGEKNKQEVLSSLSQTQESFDENIFEVTKQRWAPLYVAIQNMPLAELGSFSESMIYIATLHNKYSSDEEHALTVGGPIDVATIDRAQGLAWVHHK